MIRFDTVTKRYPGGQDALKEVSFSIDEGEMVFLTGHSGAGKSSVLKLLSVQERPTRGSVLLGGRNVGAVRAAQIPAVRRRIGQVFQDHRLLLDRTVFDNVALPLVIAGTPRAEMERRVRAALDLVGPAARERAQPQQLSAGEQQRVGIARAIAPRPKVVLADEPTASLDDERADEVLALLEEVVKEERATLVLVTHEQRVRERFSDVLDLKELGR